MHKEIPDLGIKNAGKNDLSILLYFWLHAAT
jgi:hypothetical protein